MVLDSQDLYQEAAALAPLAQELAVASGIVRYRADGTIGHLPFTLLPWRASRSFWDRGLAATLHFNKLYHAVARQPEFLREELAEARRADPFVAGLFDAMNEAPKPFLYMSRSDFMPSHLGPKQVEMNLMAASLGNSSEKVYQVMQFLYHETELGAAMPVNNAGSGLAAGLAEAFHLLKQPRSIVLMVVPPGEVNAFDQRTIQADLIVNHDVPVMRTTLEEIAAEARVQGGTLMFKGRPVTIVYFRAGYSPDHYTSPATWEGRRLVEHSDAVSVPCAATQLANTKKIQQVLSRTEKLRQFVSPDEAQVLFECQVAMAPLDEAVEWQGKVLPAREHALEDPESWVLKPFREGGGNNYFGEDMVGRLRTLTRDEAQAFIMMEAIKQPVFRGVRLVNGEVMDGNCATELGHFTSCFYPLGADVPAFERTHGYLCRTKNEENREGLVLGGFSFLDTVSLVD